MGGRVSKGGSWRGLSGDSLVSWMCLRNKQLRNYAVGQVETMIYFIPVVTSVCSFPAHSMCDRANMIRLPIDSGLPREVWA